MTLAVACLLVYVGRWRLREALSFAHLAYTRLVLGGVPPAPLGWKLEPRLAAAMQSLVSFYVRFYHAAVWSRLISVEAPLAVLSAGVAWSLMEGTPRGMAAAVWAVLVMSQAAVVALCFLACRLHRLHVQVLLSLAALFQSRFYSVLRMRQEPFSPPLDTLLLGLLVFAAALLLYPVVLLNTLFLVIAESPVTLARWLWKHSQ